MYKKTQVINERTSIIPIKKNKNNKYTNCNNYTEKYENSLNQNFFDPSKSSPPNDFLIKLNLRMKNYV